MLRIVNVPHPVLANPTKTVDKIDEEIRKFVYEMEETLASQSDPQGVGLAANQVGRDLSIFIIKKSPQADTQVFINPRILDKVSPLKVRPSKKDKKGEKLEGCLSIPRIWGPVKRSSKVLVEYQDLNSQSHKRWFKGFEAVIIQHEMDHLNGVVFTQRSMEQNAPLYKEVDGKLKNFEI
ncbi:MAG: peptide deformylase [Patescibacteria group bacterium]